jgi:uncharacterized protein
MSDLQLIEAAKAGKLAEVEHLLASGADVNQQDEQGWTPLNWVAGKGDLACVRLLLERGADVFKVGRDQRTPYKIALAAGHPEVVKVLRGAEEKAGEGRSSRSERLYSRAYPLKRLREFPGWRENRINWREDADSDGGDSDGELTDESIVHLHQDLTVTRSMWHDEDVIFNQVSPEWEEFCHGILQFRVPDDLDFITPARPLGQEAPA